PPEGKPAGAAGGPGEGQAGDLEGPVPAEDLGQLDDGPRRRRRCVDVEPEVIVLPLRPETGGALRAVAASQGLRRQPSKTAGAVSAQRRRAWSSCWQGNAVAASGIA